MQNSEIPTNNHADLPEQSSNKGPLLLFLGAIVLVVIALWQFSGGKVEKRQLDLAELTTDEVEVAPKEAFEEPEVIEQSISEPIIEEPPVEIAVDNTEEPIVENPLPVLDDSDVWLQEKLPTMTWRKELLKLVIDEDMIRRFVVFTDNFAQGNVVYEHSPFVLPQIKFSPSIEHETKEGSKTVWQWDESSSKRFNLYIDLLRSMDSSSLVEWYFEVKPLIDDAYNELGYEEDFTLTLQDAITRVLDMELPKSSMALTRPSVMYKYQDETLESLADSDKLLLRLGKENLLIIKSILLEINEKIAQKNNGVH